MEDQPPENKAAPSGAHGPSALPSSALPPQNIVKPRRHKAAAAPEPSVEDPAFPLEIQKELLNQVRYWQSQAESKEEQIQEYDTKFTEMSRTIQALNELRRQHDKSDGNHI